jgi:hypothetical protein
VDDENLADRIIGEFMPLLSWEQKGLIIDNMARNPKTTMHVATGCSGSDLYLDSWKAWCIGMFI